MQETLGNLDSKIDIFKFYINNIWTQTEENFVSTFAIVDFN